MTKHIKEMSVHKYKTEGDLHPLLSWNTASCSLCQHQEQQRVIWRQRRMVQTTKC